MYFGWPRTSRKLLVPVHFPRHAVRQSHGDALKLPKRLSAFSSGNGSRDRQGKRLNQSQGEMYISLDRTIGAHPVGA